jgi:alanyl-tRNA synthetase
MLERLKDADREIAKLRADRLKSDLSSLAEQAQDVDGVRVLSFAAPAGTAAAELRQVVVDARGRLGDSAPAVVVGLAEADGKVAAIAATNAPARERSLSAQTLLRVALERVGGRGGGKDDLAQGGGADPSGIDDALAAVVAAVRGSDR